jgi:uncharacterized protein YbjT (DUF2867 family)
MCEGEIEVGGKILVTGATGNVGREVVRSLLKLGKPVVAAAMDERDANCVPAGAEIVFFDFGKSETYPAAFKGVEKLFLMRPPQITDMKRYLFPVIDFAKSTSISHIVFLIILTCLRTQHTLTIYPPGCFRLP